MFLKEENFLAKLQEELLARLKKIENLKANDHELLEELFFYDQMEIKKEIRELFK